ncbi:DUF1573 domain-containing protein [Mucilaginibacter gynuensis]|uniref:DUF1573 domain-containing protein n=1 Tax=Mucilaginibacter gynuensis TaxID=1302236 RepID=A0ABP8HJI9_9SPHI
MKKIFLSLVAATVILAACNQSKTNNSESAADTTATNGVTAASAPVDSAQAPVIQFEVPMYQFGKVTEGEKVNYEYKFTNTGKSPLIIANAVASCGCTVPEWPKTPIAPNAGGVIKVTFNSANKVGVQDKLITVTANTVPAQTVVHLVGEVVAKK